MTGNGVASRFKRIGISKAEGGRLLRARENAKQCPQVKETERKVRFLLRIGMTAEHVDSYQLLKFAHQRFQEQRRRARQRGIDWLLTFKEWWGVWTESGKWDERGRSKALSAVMSRYGDVGPYALGNVHITTLSANFIESWESAPNRIHGGRLKILREEAECLA